MTELRITYKRAGGYWKGALKDQFGKVVWTCDHVHKNRDTSTYTFGTSACGCARIEHHRRTKCEAA